MTKHKQHRTSVKIFAVAAAAALLTGSGGIANILPSNVSTSIHAYALSPTNPESVTDYRINDDGTITVTAINEDDINAVIPSYVDFKKVTAVSLISPDDLGTGRYSNLKTITLPDTLKSIDDYAFFGIFSLETVQMQNGVEYIGESAFDHCHIQNIVIPSTVKTLGNGAFHDCNPESITMLNPNMEILTSLKGSATIYGYSGSTAEKCVASSNKYNAHGTLKFVSLLSNRNSRLTNNQKVLTTSTWVNWNNITANADFNASYSLKYKYSYKDDINNKWIDITKNYVTNNTCRIPALSKPGNYTIRIAALDENGGYTSKYTYLMVKQDTKKTFKDNGSKLSAYTLSKGNSLTAYAKFTGGVVPYRYKYSYRLNNDAWKDVQGYSTADKHTIHIPSKAGKYTVRIACRDGKGQYTSKYFIVNVK